MSRKSKSSNNGSDNNLLASLLHDRGRKLFGGTSGEQDLGDSSVVQQNQEFSINSKEFPSLPGSEAVPGIGNRNAVQGLGNASPSNLTTNIGSGNPSVQGQNQPSSSVLQQGSSSGGPSSQSNVPTVNSPKSKGWFYDVSSNTKFPGDLSDYFPSADPPDAFQRLQEQQDPLQRESSSSHQQGQQQIPAVSTGGTSSSVNTEGAGGSIPGVLQASASSGLGVFQNEGPQITSSETAGNILRSISSDVQEQNQPASGVLQQGSSAGGPISQSQVQAVNSPNPLGNLNDNINADIITNLCGKEKVQEYTVPPQHTPMSRTVGFSSGESSSSHQQGQQQFPAVSTGGTSSSMNSQDLLQNTNGAGGSIPGIFPASAASSNWSVIQGLENAGPRATSSEGNQVSGGKISRSINSGGESSDQVMIGVLQQGSSALGPIPQSQGPNDANSNDSFRPNLPDATSNIQQNQELGIRDGNLPGFTGNADSNTNLRGKEKEQENTMPILPRQHPPAMSRSVGFSSGESSSSHRPQTNAVSGFEQLINWSLGYAVRGLREQNREFCVETLFKTIYSSPYEYCRVYAEDELYNRGWFYHNGLKSWLLKDPNVPLSEKTQTHEKGSYMCFDPVLNRSIRKDDFVVEYKMLKERPALP